MMNVNISGVIAQTKSALSKHAATLFILCLLPGLFYLARVLSYPYVSASLYYTLLWAAQVVAGLFSAAAIMAILRGDSDMSWQQSYKTVKKGVIEILVPPLLVVLATAVLASMRVITPQIMYVVFVLAHLYVIAGGMPGLQAVRKDVSSNQTRWLTIVLHAAIFAVVVYYINATIYTAWFRAGVSYTVIGLYATLYFTAVWMLAFTYFHALYRAVFGGQKSQ